MAYLDVRDAAMTAPFMARDTMASTTVAVEPIGFTRNEWQVIVLAQRDGLASVYPPSWVAKLMGRLFGEGANPRLADPRLETLRRLAVHAWAGSFAVPVSAIKAAKASGFSGDQIELLLASVANGRPSSTRRLALA